MPNMPNVNERPICHRAEDLVTYLYGEASEADAKDFSLHLQQCNACRGEFGVFQQVHDSILVWRNEALGSAFNPAVRPVESAVELTQSVRDGRRLSALAALREFFTVSPLWLRGATAFAAVLLCTLGVLTISRSWNRPVLVTNREPGVFPNPEREPKYSKQEVDEAVRAEIARLKEQQTSAPVNEGLPTKKPTGGDRRNQLADNLVRPKALRPRGLSRQEREQLAKDLRLIPRDEDELPFVLSDEPNQ
jgi:hypothetical protein